MTTLFLKYNHSFWFLSCKLTTAENTDEFFSEVLSKKEATEKAAKYGKTLPETVKNNETITLATYVHHNQSV